MVRNERHDAIKKTKKLMGFSPDILNMYEKLNPELLDIISRIRRYNTERRCFTSQN